MQVRCGVSTARLGFWRVPYACVQKVWPVQETTGFHTEMSGVIFQTLCPVPFCFFFFKCYLYFITIIFLKREKAVVQELKTALVFRADLF